MTRTNSARSARTRAGALLIATTLMAGVAVFAIAAQSKVTLRFNFKNGQKLTYTTTAKVTSDGMGGARNGAQGGTMNIDATQAIVISEASAKGFTAKTTTSMTQQGKKRETTQTAKYDARGAQLSGSSSQPGGPMAGIGPGGFLGMTFPAEAVGVGSTWTVDIDLKNAMGGMGGGAQAPQVKGRIPVKYTLKSFGTKAGKRVANITAVINGTVTMGEGQNNMSMTLKGTAGAVVEVATGIIHESTMTGDATVAFSGMNMVSKISTKTVLK
ncbi:MAG: hypothetical protein KF784_01415 [Fimbriimonadaceae bacterium]|nr:hypothetical protein [Fimbriimonadaceae bacterium]